MDFKNFTHPNPPWKTGREWFAIKFRTIGKGIALSGSPYFLPPSALFQSDCALSQMYMSIPPGELWIITGNLCIIPYFHLLYPGRIVHCHNRICTFLQANCRLFRANCALYQACTSFIPTELCIVEDIYVHSSSRIAVCRGRFMRYPGLAPVISQPLIRSFYPCLMLP